MEDRYLLYIDVLGFRELCCASSQSVDDLFEVVASLNLNNHSQFAAIAFSDTILVHNLPSPTSADDRRYIVMYQCEFFRDLLLRTAGRELSFRAVLTHGPFEHYRLNDVPFFYGETLIRAYDVDKDLKITGLVMDSDCREYSNIFSTRPLDRDWSYVFTTQALDAWEDEYLGVVPVPQVIIEDSALAWKLGPELEVLASSARQAVSHSNSEVRKKHVATLDQYRKRYPRIFRAMEPKSFAMEAASDSFDWTRVRKRMMETYSWGTTRTPPKAGK